MKDHRGARSTAEAQAVVTLWTSQHKATCLQRLYSPSPLGFTLSTAPSHLPHILSRFARVSLGFLAEGGGLPPGSPPRHRGVAFTSPRGSPEASPEAPRRLPGGFPEGSRRGPGASPEAEGVGAATPAGPRPHTRRLPRSAAAPRPRPFRFLPPAAGLAAALRSFLRSFPPCSAPCLPPLRPSPFPAPPSFPPARHALTSGPPLSLPPPPFRPLWGRAPDGAKQRLKQKQQPKRN